MDEALALDGGGVPVIGGVPVVGGVSVDDKTHVALLVTSPAEHDVRSLTTYPELHWGTYDMLLASVAVQLPIQAPFAGTVDASHGLAAHVAGVRDPLKHEAGPETVYPVLHTGLHCDPDASVAVQSPPPPFSGAVDASHDTAATLTAPVGAVILVIPVAIDAAAAALVENAAASLSVAIAVVGYRNRRVHFDARGRGRRRSKDAADGEICARHRPKRVRRRASRRRDVVRHGRGEESSTSRRRSLDVRDRARIHAQRGRGGRLERARRRRGGERHRSRDDVRELRGTDTDG